MLLRLVNDIKAYQLSPANGVQGGVTYFPQAPEITVNKLEDVLRNGDPVTSVTRRNVVEPVQVLLKGNTQDILDLVHGIETMVQAAEGGNETYIEYQTRAGEDIYRSPLLAGRVNWSGEAGLRKLTAETTTVQLDINWERAYYWEGALREAALSSSTQTARTGGVTAYLDSRNWAHMAAAQILGAAPTPAKIQVRNMSGGTLTMRGVYAGVNVFNNPTSFDAYMAGSEGINGATHSWSVGGTSHTNPQLNFNLSSEQISAGKGNYFRVLAGFSSITSRIYARAHVGPAFYPSLSGPEAYTNDSIPLELLDLGALPIPPRKGAANSGVGLMISFRSRTSGIATLNSVHLLPARNTRKVYKYHGNTPNGQSITLDGPAGVAYTESGSSTIDNVNVEDDAPVWLWPGREQRLHVVFDEGLNFQPGRQMTLRVWYRPRRLTV